MRHYRRIPTPAHLRVINVRPKHKVPYPVGGFLGGGERMERSSRTTLVVHYMHDESERILYPLLKLLLDLENSLANVTNQVVATSS